VTRPDETEELIEKRKMYVVVRGDLPPGLRAAQAGHAIAEVAMRNPQPAEDWLCADDGNYLIILDVENERHLLYWLGIIERESIPCAAFKEPDLGNEWTAFAAFPEPSQNHLFSYLPLAYTKRRWGARLRRYFGVIPS
jgi:hypothetical protein